jgi:hypothetical protein
MLKDVSAGHEDVLFRYGSADIRLTVDERNWGRD